MGEIIIIEGLTMGRQHYEATTGEGNVVGKESTSALSKNASKV